MILKRNFNPLKVLSYVWKELFLSLLTAALAYFLFNSGQLKLHIPFSVAAILGSALAIFIAFRNNSSYSRWWEARTIWGGIINNSRIFARQLIANAENAIATGKANSEKIVSFKKEMIDRQVAFAHALRLHLRRQESWQELQHLLDKKEFETLLTFQNKPNFVLLQQGIRIKEAMREEILGPFDNISMEPNLATFNNWQGSCERIKNTPLLRQYDYFTKLFLWVFTVLLPFSLVADFNKLEYEWLLMPVCIIISFVFAVMGKVGEVNEDPFENRITDVPLTALCNTIERDLKEMLGEKELPEKLNPERGYLF
jgi:ion channel-forming bestrophin family protein